MIKEIDSNGDGQISYDEFCEMMMKVIQWIYLLSTSWLTYRFKIWYVAFKWLTSLKAMAYLIEIILIYIRNLICFLYWVCLLNYPRACLRTLVHYQLRLRLRHTLKIILISLWLLCLLSMLRLRLLNLSCSLR